MLDYIRANTQSFGVKVAFGIIILVFVFWGVGSFTDTDSDRVLAKVNGEAILEPQFYRQYQQTENQLLQQGITKQQMKAQHLGRQVLHTMICQILVRQEAQRLGLAVTPRELREEIEKNSLFLNAQGKLDADSYARGLKLLRLSAASFEEMMRQEMIIDHMFELVTSSIWVNPNAAYDRYCFLFEKRVLDYIYLPAAEYLQSCSVTQDECKSYYDAHKAEFTVPKKAIITYIKIDPEKIVDPKSITEAQLTQWYEKNQKLFTQKEAVRCAHILVPIDHNDDAASKKKAQETIEKIQEQLKSGRKFADLANQHNSANAAEKDGEIGWIERGVTVEPFEQAAFALKPGSVSEPVETKFGLHLILVHEKREASTKPLAEVQAEALKLMTTELGQDKMNEVMESLLEDNVLGKDLSQSAKHFNLEAVMTEPLSVLELMAKLEFSREDVDFMLSGSPIDSPMQSGKTACVVRVNKIEPEKVKEYEDVRKQIEQTLLAEKALSKAREKAQNLRKELKNEVTEKEKKDLQIQTSNPVERQSVVDPFLPNQELSDACFAAAPKTWLEDVYTVEKKDGSRGVLLAFVKSVEVADQESWERIKAIMERGLERDTAENLRDFFIKELLRTAKITNVNLDKVDHMDM